MPVTSRYQPHQTYQDVGGKSYKLYLINTLVRQTVKPTTVKRLRPKDRFASGTSWESSDKILNHGSATAYSPSVSYSNIPLMHTVDYTGPLPLSPDFVVTENAVRSKLRETYVNLSVAMAELPKTADMIRKNIMNFYEVYRKIRRLDPNLVLMPYYALREKRARERWLEYHYGVRPLIGEVDGAMRALHARVQRPSFFQGRCRNETADDASWKQPLSFQGRAFQEVQLYQKVKFQQQIIYRVSYDTTKPASQLAPFGLTNPLLTAWELIPFSFVADWFINVGDTVASLDNLHSVRSLDVIRSYRLHETITCDGSRNVGGSGTYSHRKWVRQLPSPMSPVMRLVYNPHLSITRLISATALLRQAQANAKNTK